MVAINRSFNVGRARVTCVDELTIGGQLYSENFAPFDETSFAQCREELPAGYSRQDSGLVMKVQNWLIQVDGRNILIDSGFGNGKTIPGLPPQFSHLDTAFLTNLAVAGVAPAAVEMVIMTHVHVDHIGWNTRWDGREWVPTFANARHVVTRIERQYWDSSSPHYRPKEPSRALMANCFEQSMLPIINEGLVDAKAEDAQIDDLLTYIPAPGHTPGLSAIKFECDGEGVLFAGDAMHHPIQIAIPEWCIVWDEDYASSITSRRRLLAMCADQNLVLAPAHFAHQACRVARKGNGFAATNLAMDSVCIP